MINYSYQPTQAEFAELFGISQPTVSGLLTRGIINENGTLQDWATAYAGHLREIAAGRAALGDLDLATERARLAKEQADRVAMLNAIQRCELAPVAAMEMVLANVGTKVGKILDTIPAQIKRRVPGITAEVIAAIDGDITKCRHLAASMTLASLDEPDED